MRRGKRFLSRFVLSIFTIVSLVVVLWNATEAQASANTKILHSFTGGSSDGTSNLTLSGSTLYGMTFQGGSGGAGTIFQINLDGTGLTILHNFTGGPSDGANPMGSLTLSGSTLYGMTFSGGANNDGTIFKVNTDGTGFQLLHSFDGWIGYNFEGCLTLSGSTLYGVTIDEGGNNDGTIFKVNTDGTGFQLLHSFTLAGNEGYYPQGSLTLSGSILYGVNRAGGSNPGGTIFQINTDGTGLTTLHNFTGGPSDGAYPLGSLTLSGSTLCGMTSSGGTSGIGTIFKINLDGTGFQLLHSFSGYSYPTAYNPQGSLSLSGSTLYGMTSGGGTNYQGTIFKINTDGTGFQLLRSFTISDGYEISGSLTLSGSTLCGVTLQRNSTLFTTGKIFKINTDGTGFQLVYSFPGDTGDGYYPQASLTPSGSTLYGMTYGGGTDGGGTIFKINTDGTGYQLLHSFAGGSSDGYYPQGSLTLSGSTLYGMTGYGGTRNDGTIFKINTDGTGFQLLYSFESYWYNPQGSLTLSGSTLYGMTTWSGYGTIFKINTDGTGFQDLHIFAGGSNDGGIP